MGLFYELKMKIEQFSTGLITLVNNPFNNNLEFSAIKENPQLNYVINNHHKMKQLFFPDFYFKAIIFTAIKEDLQVVGKFCKQNFQFRNRFSMLLSFELFLSFYLISHKQQFIFLLFAVFSFRLVVVGIHFANQSLAQYTVSSQSTQISFDLNFSCHLTQ